MSKFANLVVMFAQKRNQSAIHLGPFLGSHAYEVINWSGFHYGSVY